MSFVLPPKAWSEQSTDAGHLSFMGLAIVCLLWPVCARLALFFDLDLTWWRDAFWPLPWLLLCVAITCLFLSIRALISPSTWQESALMIDDTGGLWLQAGDAGREARGPDPELHPESSNGHLAIKTAVVRLACTPEFAWCGLDNAIIDVSIDTKSCRIPIRIRREALDPLDWKQLRRWIVWLQRS